MATVLSATVVTALVVFFASIIAGIWIIKSKGENFTQKIIVTVMALVMTTAISFVTATIVLQHTLR